MENDLGLFTDLQGIYRQNNLAMHSDRIAATHAFVCHACFYFKKYSIQIVYNFFTGYKDLPNVR